VTPSITPSTSTVPITLSTTVFCDSPVYDGNGRVYANAFSGGTNSFEYITISSISSADALSKLDNSATRTFIGGATEYNFTGLANATYYVAIMDYSGNKGVSSAAVVSCIAPSPSPTSTPSVTRTPSITPTPSVTVTPSITRTPSVTPTISITPSTSTVGVTLNTTPGCDGGANTGTVYANNFQGGTNSFDYIAISAVSPTDALLKLDNPATRVFIGGATDYTFTSLYNATFYVAIMDTAGNKGVSTGASVYCIDPTPSTTATPSITRTPSVTPTPTPSVTPSITPTPSYTYNYYYVEVYNCGVGCEYGAQFYAYAKFPSTYSAVVGKFYLQASGFQDYSYKIINAVGVQATGTLCSTTPYDTCYAACGTVPPSATPSVTPTPTVTTTPSTTPPPPTPSNSPAAGYDFYYADDYSCADPCSLSAVDQFVAFPAGSSVTLNKWYSWSGGTDSFRVTSPTSDPGYPVPLLYDTDGPYNNCTFACSIGT
jgi:hypothetical protein